VQAERYGDVSASRYRQAAIRARDAARRARFEAAEARQSFDMFPLP
jgi:hypothetical protein